MKDCKMIEEPPLITLKTRTSRNRPTPQQIAAFVDVPTGFLCDAMEGQGALDYTIKCLPGLPDRVVGPALTCHCGPQDILALVSALTEVEPGDVVVNATGSWRGCAAIGDRVSGMAKNAGAAGVVTDGLARDLPGIQDVGLPLFCAGISPNSPFGKGPGSVGMAIKIAGHLVDSGDMIVADQDGVVVVPFARIDEVIETLIKVKELEAELDGAVAKGLKAADSIVELVNGPQCRRI